MMNALSYDGGTQRVLNCASGDAVGSELWCEDYSDTSDCRELVDGLWGEGKRQSVDYQAMRRGGDSGTPSLVGAASGKGCSTVKRRMVATREWEAAECVDVVVKGSTEEHGCPDLAA